MSWFSESIFNLKNMVAIKGMVTNLTSNPWQWLLNELAPSSYINPDHVLHFHNLVAEMKGWLGQHVPIGFAVQLVWMLLCYFFPNKLKPWMGLALMGTVAFVIEIIQTFIAKFAYINPLNSLLDIGFYVAGSAIALFLVKKFCK